MKTTLDIVDILWEKLDGSALKVEITGSICKHRRDPNSTVEDVVINCLPAPNTQLQRVFANVNIHLPDLIFTANGQQDKQPNHTRLLELAAMAVAILEDNWTSDLNYDVQQQGLFPDEEGGGHYINMRLEFFIENV